MLGYAYRTIRYQLPYILVRFRRPLPIRPSLPPYHPRTPYPYPQKISKPSPITPFSTHKNTTGPPPSNPQMLSVFMNCHFCFSVRIIGFTEMHACSHPLPSLKFKFPKLNVSDCKIIIKYVKGRIS